LVLDNVAAPEQMRDCCPSSGNGRVIVTTRDRAMAQFGPALAVDVFDEPTAVEYLLARAGRQEDRAGAVRLARALAMSYGGIGRLGEATELGERVVADSERILGLEHPDTLRARLCLAVSYQHAGRTTEAIKLGEEVLAARARLLGAQHPYTLGARAVLAASYSRAGRTDAIELLERVLADSERILGCEHPVTLSARRRLAEAYRETDRAADAAEATEQHAPRAAGSHGGGDA